MFQIFYIINFLFFFEFFSENVLKTLLRGRETTRKKYRIVFEKFLKYVIFFDFGCPSPITHPSPIRQYKRALAWDPGGLEYSGNVQEGLPHLKENRTNLKLNRLSALGSWLSAFSFRLSAFGFRLLAFGFRIKTLGFRLQNFGCRLSAFGFPINRKISHSTNFFKCG